MLTIIKRKEKVLIWMHRNQITGQQIADNVGITRQAFNTQFKNDNFSDDVLNTMKSMGFRE
jgi:predicted transcriptional regulator